MDSFEKQLRRQPLREVPPAWRAPILAQARAAAANPAPANSPVNNASAQIGFYQQLRAWLWPHPVAWSLLAACWLMIAALQFSLGEPTATVAAKREAPASAETIAELKREHRLLAELTGQAPLPDADRVKQSPGQPRTEGYGIATV